MTQHALLNPAHSVALTSHTQKPSRELVMLGAGILIVASFTVPMFRSGGRTGLNFWQWIINHTIFGPPVEYVPEEDYMRELEGIIQLSESKSGGNGYSLLSVVKIKRTLLTGREQYAIRR